MRRIYTLITLIALSSQPALAENPIVDIQTNQGTITAELYPDKAPLTVANFLAYVNEGFYKNTLFHRVIKNFMIQGGGYTSTSQLKTTHSPIKLESNNGLSNLRGTLAMARTVIPDSATSQFFINSIDNQFLNYQNTANPGYAVFGKVLEGLDTVDSISAVTTNNTDTPLQPVIIETVRQRQAQLGFINLKTAYRPGDTFTLSVQENTIRRTEALDLWVAVQLADGHFLFMSQDTPGLFSQQATPF